MEALLGCQTGALQIVALVAAAVLTLAAVAQQLLLAAGLGSLLPGWQPWPFLLGAAPAWWLARPRWRRADPPRPLVVAMGVLRRIPGAAYLVAVHLGDRVQFDVELLSARAPRLDRALKKIARKGGVVVLLDGTLVRTRRRTGNENRPNYSGKHKAHGLLFLALTRRATWSGSRRRSRALQRDHHRPPQQDHHPPAGGRSGRCGRSRLRRPGRRPRRPGHRHRRRATRGHPLTDAQKEANRLVSRERAANEHGFADLKNWWILTKVRMNARHATTLLRALLVLTNAEVHR